MHEIVIQIVDLLLIALTKISLKVTNVGIEELSSGDAIKSLHFICLANCERLTDLSLRYLVLPHNKVCLFPSDLAPHMSGWSSTLFYNNFFTQIIILERI